MSKHTHIHFSINNLSEANDIIALLRSNGLVSDDNVEKVSTRQPVDNELKERNDAMLAVHGWKRTPQVKPREEELRKEYETTTNADVNWQDLEKRHTIMEALGYDIFAKSPSMLSRERTDNAPKSATLDGVDLSALEDGEVPE